MEMWQAIASAGFGVVFTLIGLVMALSAPAWSVVWHFPLAGDRLGAQHPGARQAIHRAVR